MWNMVNVSRETLLPQPALVPRAVPCPGGQSVRKQPRQGRCWTASTHSLNRLRQRQGERMCPKAITIIREQVTEKTLMVGCSLNGVEGRRPDNRIEQAVWRFRRLAYCESPLLTMRWGRIHKREREPHPTSAVEFGQYDGRCVHSLR